MRKICLMLSLISWFTYSQNKQLLYGFSEIPQSLLQNPGGKVVNKGYFGIPLLSHLHVSSGVKGGTVFDLFAEDGIGFNIKLESFVNKARPEDFFTFNQQVEVLSGGFSLNNYGKKKYISFGIYQELDFIAYFPKDFVILALEGNQANINRPFRADNINGAVEVVSVWHVGFNKKVSDKFTYGVRGKIYSSIINANTTKNEGSFITTTSDNNFYKHIFDLDIALQTSGYTSNGIDPRFERNDVSKRLLLGGNLGLGFDVGFTYNFSKQLTFDASLQDVGFIRHTKDVENYKIKGDFVFEGVDPIFFDASEGDTADEFFSEVEQEFEDLFDVNDNNDGYTTWRPVKFNTSLNYSFGKQKIKDCNCLAGEDSYVNRVGAQLYTIKRPKSLQLALTAYYYKRFFKGLRGKLSYTLDSYSFNNIGLGVSTHIGGANFYILADNFLQYENIYDAQSVSLQLGFNYIFNNNEK